MEIRINGKTSTIERGAISVSELLKVEDVESPDMVSVQINGEILDRNQFDTTSVQKGDEIEFLYFMGGGQAV